MANPSAPQPRGPEEPSVEHPQVRPGIWTTWTSVRKVKEGETTNDLFAFLTTEPNEIVAPIHPKAMPVILTKPDEVEDWLTAPIKEALRLQRPLPNDALRIVARGEKQDPAPLGRV